MSNRDSAVIAFEAPNPRVDKRATEGFPTVPTGEFHPPYNDG